MQSIRVATQCSVTCLDSFTNIPTILENCDSHLPRGTRSHFVTDDLSSFLVHVERFFEILRKRTAPCKDQSICLPKVVLLVAISDSIVKIRILRARQDILLLSTTNRVWLVQPIVRRVRMFLGIVAFVRRFFISQSTRKRKKSVWSD